MGRAEILLSCVLFFSYLFAQSVTTSADSTDAIIDSLEEAAFAVADGPETLQTIAETTEVVENNIAEVDIVPPQAGPSASEEVFTSADTAVTAIEEESISTTSAPSGAASFKSRARRLAARIRRIQILRVLRLYSGHFVALVVSAVIIVLTAAFFIRKRDSTRFLTTTRLSIVDKEVQRACNFIEKNYADSELSVDKICDKLVSGAAFLQALFVQELGMSAEEFIAQVRMNRARITLGENPQIPLEELTASTGYGDSADFVKAFLRITGISLEDYRANVEI